MPSIPTFADAQSCDHASVNAAEAVAWLNGLIDGKVIELLLDPQKDAATIADEMASAAPAGFQWFVRLVTEPFIGFWRMLSGVAWGDPNCNVAGVGPSMVAKTLIGFLQRWAGSGLDKPLERLSRYIDYQCPTGIPSQSEVNSLLARGIITDELWSCWTRANNNLTSPQHTIVQGMENVPNPLELVMLKNREKIGALQYDQLMQVNAVRFGTTKQLYEFLAEFIPGPSDLVRFMVRDVADQVVVDKYDLDFEFDEKFKGVLLDWAKGQGVPEQAMRFFWRAHWEIPSPTQGYEMYHRLRPGRVDPSLVFSRDDLAQMLEINDMAPWFVQKIVEINRPLLRLIDLRKAFYFHVIDAKELGEQMQDRGHSVKDAQIIVDSQVIARWDFLKGRKWYKSWVAGGLTFAQVVEESDKEGVDLLDLADLKQSVDIERRSKTLTICTRAVKKRFMIGDITQSGAVSLLLNAGHDLDYAGEEVLRWVCELQAKGKLINAGELCSWVEKGLISASEYQLRLIHLGYTEADARRITRICGMKIEEKAAKIAEKLRKEREAAEKRRIAEEAKKFLEGQRKEEKRKRARSGIELAEEKAHLKWIKAAAVVAVAAAADIDEVRKYIAERINELIDHRGWSLIGAADLVVELAAEIKANKITDYQAVFASAFAALPRRDVFDEAHGPTMTTVEHPDMADLAKPLP